MLVVHDLGVRYHAEKILSNISFSIPAGTFTALLGPNGTGKSSLLKAVAGLIPSIGVVDLDENHTIPPLRRGESIAYMPQDTGASSSLTVLEVVLLGKLQSLGLQIPNSLIEEAMQMLEYFDLDELSTRTLQAISGGQRQLVYLAQSLFRNPRVLLLDEPTAALDFRHQLIVLERVIQHCRQKGTIAIAAMHDLSLAAKNADEVICLSRGSIAAKGVPVEILNESLIRQVYGVAADIVLSPAGVLHIAPLKAVETARRSHE